MFIKGLYFQFSILLLSPNFVSWAYLFIHMFIQPFDKYAGIMLIYKDEQEVFSLMQQTVSWSQR